jgi:hypothetical protein
MNKLRWLVVLAAIASPVEVLAESAPASPPSKISLKDFASLPVLSRPLLSPDGHRIAALSKSDSKSKVVFLNADDPQARTSAIMLGSTNVAKMKWAGNKKVLLTVEATQKWEGEDISFLRLLSVDTITGGAMVLDRKSTGIYAGDVLYADPTGSWALVASQDNIWVTPSVKRIDLATGEATVVEKDRPGVWDWYADEKGVIRAGIAYSDRRWTIWYRDNPS